MVIQDHRRNERNKIMDEPDMDYAMKAMMSNAGSGTFRNEAKIGQTLLDLLRATNACATVAVQRESSDPAQDGTHGMVRKALVRHMRLVAHWPEDMIEDVISYALDNNCSLQEAAY